MEIFERDRGVVYSTFPHRALQTDYTKKFYKWLEFSFFNANGPFPSSEKFLISILQPEKRMKLEDFIRNLRAIDEGHDLDPEMLAGIYERIRNQEFRPGSDHVTQVMKVQQTIVAKCPNLSVPHRRLVCYCRLYEVQDRHKKERPGMYVST